MDMRGLSIFRSRHMMVLTQSCRAFVESLGQFRQVSKFWDRMDIFSTPDMFWGNLVFDQVVVGV
jgi:hypothetical protein